ncbi:hypothetical protein ACERIM_10935 [Natrinema sp. H-ect1]|uniref:hypothetical protein n=1 Tax=Natrinema sp. H-ect1 TaxID=3242700 RepID=UPI00359DDF8E
MIDREGRVLFGSLLVFVLAVAVSVVLEGQFGVSLRDGPVVAVLLFAGVAVAIPQLYLAATDATIRPRSRLRFAALATAVFAVAFAAEAEGLRELVIATIGTGALLALVCYEGVTGYRAAGGDFSFDLGSE